MKRGPWRVLALLLVLLLIGAETALARRSSSSFSRGWSSSSGRSGWSSSRPSSRSWGSSRPSRPSSSGWSNASRPGSSSSGWGNSARPSGSGWSNTPGGIKSTEPSRPTGSGWSNTRGVRAPSSATPTQRSSSFATSGQTAIQKKASRQAYERYTGRFAKPNNPVPPSETVGGPRPTRTWDNYRDYSRHRDTYYAGRGWTPPPYAYRSFSSFGMWDAMFLWFMLRQASGPTFMYNHQNDPGVQAFQQEADKLAASNADLKKQLADLDAKMDQMRRDGVKPDPSAMPAGVDTSVALAAQNVVKEQPDARGGMRTGLLIAFAGFGVAALFLLASRRRRNA